MAKKNGFFFETPIGHYLETKISMANLSIQIFEVFDLAILLKILLCHFNSFKPIYSDSSTRGFMTCQFGNALGEVIRKEHKHTGNALT